jgi:hypothetical protein
VRKHQKVEDPRWLYWCDRLGLLVWGEMANARSWSLEAEQWFSSEWERVVRRDLNHPCIIAWVPFNESWGLPGLCDQHPAQYAFAERMVALTRQLDPTRPVIANDGWEHTASTDVLSLHDYTPDATRFARRYRRTSAGAPFPQELWYGRAVFACHTPYQGQPIVLSEVGGFLLQRDASLPDYTEGLYENYGSFAAPAELLKHYENLMRGLARLPFLAGFCYTQLTDIEQEVNGLLRYDRQPKVAPEAIAALHQQYFGSPCWERLARWRESQKTQ